MGPIYKFFRGRLTKEWRQLSQAEQDELWEKVNGALEQVGGERMIVCDARWHSDQWEYVGVEVFPNIEAVQRHAELLDDLGWFRYRHGESTLGTELERE